MSNSKIKESLFLYKDFFKKNIDPSLIFDKKGNIGYVSNSLLKLSGYELEEIEGKHLIYLFPDKEKSRVEKLIEETLDKDLIFRDFNTFLFTKNKKEIPVALSLLPLIGERNQKLGGMAVFIDIRQLEGILKSLELARSELEDKVKERTKELQEKLNELQKWYKVAIGRELKMKELKEEIERLKGGS